jgi:NRAMP (natural resistance-associated macrophage protein)-like metal ion transporter
MAKRERFPIRASRPVARALGLGLITGAADDDPSAIGTYAAAGARFGFSLLWTAPITFPLMFAVVYLSAKLAQVGGAGLFDLIRKHYPAWILYPALISVMLGNTIEAAADLGGITAAVRLLLPLPHWLIVVVISIAIFGLQVFGSYGLIRNIFRWLALALFAYAGAAFMARPDPWQTLRGTLIPTIHFNAEFLSILVAITGTTLSAYLYSWQSNEEVEEEIAMGRTTLDDRQGATKKELRQSRMDILLGMLFSNVIMYFIMLSTAATLNKAGHTEIATAADAAKALAPLAGNTAGALFTIGIIGVGFLAVPVMTTGAAYDLCQSFGWKHSLHAHFSDTPAFYACIAVVTAVAAALNFLGFNPMKALVWAGIVQGFSTPSLLLLIIFMTNNVKIMGPRVNTRAMNLLGWATFLIVSAGTVSLLVTWLIQHAS